MDKELLVTKYFLSLIDLCKDPVAQAWLEKLCLLNASELDQLFVWLNTETDQHLNRLFLANPTLRAEWFQTENLSQRDESDEKKDGTEKEAKVEEEQKEEKEEEKVEQEEKEKPAAEEKANENPPYFELFQDPRQYFPDSD